MSRRYYITTPIYYVNGAPHIGHAYTSIAADVMARFKRLDGYDVFFLTGTDEHGQKVERAAAEAGLDPQSFTDKVSADFRDMALKMGVSFDDYIRTTEERHKKSSMELWRRIDAAGFIYLGHYEGWYAVRDEAFYDEAEFITPAGRRNEVISFVRGGLRDLSISRTTFNWGIPVPGAPDHVMYVWLDALQNYVTACGFPDESAARWRFWPADVHMVGKDIIRFHAVYWPAFLMAAGIALPRRIASHGWWTVEGEKMSKSLGNVIEPRKLVETYGLDQVRYFLMREKPFGGDGTISHQALVTRVNVELANDLGNLAQRTLTLIARNCDGALPALGALSEDDAELVRATGALPASMREKLDYQLFNEALEEVWKLVRAANSYIDRQAPWALRRTDPARMATVLRVLADTLRALATLLQPFMPGAMGRMLDQLGVPADARRIAALAAPLPPGTPLPPPEGVFPRYVEPAA